MTDRKTSAFRENAVSFAGGTMAGVGNVFAGHPFDTLKVTMQTSHSTSVVSAYKKLVEGVGVKGLYRGISSPLVGVTPMFAVSFWSYDLGCKMIKTLKPESGKDRMSTLDYAVAGAISAFPTSLVCSPMERIKVLLQTGAESSGKYKAALNEMTRGGIKSFYSGLGATLARDIPGSALYFGAYEYFSAILNPTGQAKSISSVILSGGLAGVSMWALVIPIDVVKSKIQAAPTGTYKGMSDCARRILAEKGVAGFFHGVGPAMARAFISNGAAFLTRDLTIRLLTSAVM